MSDTPTALVAAAAQRPSWSDPREPHYADLNPASLPQYLVAAEVAARAVSLADYPPEISMARRIDDLIARGIISHRVVADALLAAYGLSDTPGS